MSRLINLFGSIFKIDKMITITEERTHLKIHKEKDLLCIEILDEEENKSVEYYLDRTEIKDLISILKNWIENEK